MSTDNIEYVQQEALYREAVEQAKEFVKTFLKENYPQLNLEATSVLNDVLVDPTALVAAYNQVNMDRARRGMSLYEITKDPTLADEEQVDRVLSNWNVSREEGAIATGSVSVILSDNGTVVIPEGEEFVINELTFQTPTTIVGVAGTPVSADERPIIDLNDGTFSLSIPVEAVSTGSVYNLRKGQQITWRSPVSTYVNSLVESDFTGGKDTQTNADLIAQLDLGTTSAVMAGRQNIHAIISEVYPSIQGTSVIGYGDAEMRRDGHNIFGIKTGGKADIYVKTATKPELRTFDIDCTLLSRTDKTFQAHITKDIFPGFYDIYSIVPAGDKSFAGSLTITQEIRSADTSDMPYPIPEMIDSVESDYTRFQTAVVQFSDPQADTTGMTAGGKVTYKLTLSGLPAINTIQDYISSRSIRPVQGDYLVKAPIPIALSMSLEVQYILGDKEVNVDAVKQAAVTAVNSIAFNRGSISSSMVVDAVQDVLEDRAIVSPEMSMRAVVRKPGGEEEVITSNTRIALPEDAETSTSSRTVNVYTDYNMVDVTIKQVETLSI